MGKHSGKPNIPMCAALILLCLTLVSTHLTCGLYARYTAGATASDSARVAKFDVKYELAENITTPDIPNDFVVTVTNDSEVAVRYTIIVECETAPLRVTLGEDSRDPAEGKIRAEFNDPDWVLAPNAETSASHVFSLELTEWTGLTGGIIANTGDTNTGTLPVDFDVSVYAVQID